MYSFTIWRIFCKHFPLETLSPLQDHLILFFFLFLPLFSPYSKLFFAPNWRFLKLSGIPAFF